MPAEDMMNTTANPGEARAQTGTWTFRQSGPAGEMLPKIMELFGNLTDDMTMVHVSIVIRVP